jgi:hypothetical protein
MRAGLGRRRECESNSRRRTTRNEPNARLARILFLGVVALALGGSCLPSGIAARTYATDQAGGAGRLVRMSLARTMRQDQGDFGRNRKANRGWRREMVDEADFARILRISTIWFGGERGILPGLRPVGHRHLSHPRVGVWQHPECSALHYVPRLVERRRGSWCDGASRSSLARTDRRLAQLHRRRAPCAATNVRSAAPDRRGRVVTHGFRLEQAGDLAEPALLKTFRSARGDSTATPAAWRLSHILRALLLASQRGNRRLESE